MKILFFSPFARVLPHSIPEATVSRELEKAGHEVRTISCGKIFQGQCCTLDALGEHHISKNPVEKICQVCTNCSVRLSPKALELASIIRDDLAEIENTIHNITSLITRENLFIFEHEGYKIGRMAAYQHMIHLKKFSPEISEDEFPIFLREVKNCLITLFGLKKFLSDTKYKPEICITFNSLYSVNAIFCEFFSREGAQPYSLHSGANLNWFQDTACLMKNNTFDYLNLLKDKFASARVHISESRIKYVLSHFEVLAKGNSAFAYSKQVDYKSSEEIRNKFKIPNSRKIILAAMSSYDERFAAEYCGKLQSSQDSVFSTQIDWIKWLLAFAKEKLDIHLIIRLHPREFPNKRESVKSKHAEMVLDIVKNRTENVSINTPEDKISLYDVARECDVALTSWSSAGKELLLLGMPVVIYSADSQWYPSSITKCARNLQEYSSLISEALTETWTINNTINALRWLSFETIDNTFSLSTRLSLSRKTNTRKRFIKFISNLFGPDFFISWRTGKVHESDLLSACLANGKLKCELSTQPQSQSHNEVTKIVRNQLPYLGRIIFGENQSKWPTNFLDMINKY